MAKIINLRTFYPWCTGDEFLEVSDEVADALEEDKRYEATFRRVNRRYMVYSLESEVDPESEEFACCDDDPAALLEFKERYCNLCRALNSLPEIQGRRIDAYFLLGKTQPQIADEEGVVVSCVSDSIERGLKAMKIFLQNPQKCTKKCLEIVPYIGGGQLHLSKTREGQGENAPV